MAARRRVETMAGRATLVESSSLSTIPRFRAPRRPTSRQPRLRIPKQSAYQVYKLGYGWRPNVTRSHNPKRKHQVHFPHGTNSPPDPRKIRVRTAVVGAGDFLRGGSRFSAGFMYPKCDLPQRPPGGPILPSSAVRPPKKSAAPSGQRSPARECWRLSATLRRDR